MLGKQMRDKCYDFCYMLLHISKMYLFAKVSHMCTLLQDF